MTPNELARKCAGEAFPPDKFRGPQYDENEAARKKCVQAILAYETERQGGATMVHVLNCRCAYDPNCLDATARGLPEPPKEEANG